MPEFDLTMSAEEQAATVPEAAEMVGGEERLEKLLAWAASVLPARELEAFNRRVVHPTEWRKAIEELDQTARALHAVNEAGLGDETTGAQRRPAAAPPSPTLHIDRGFQSRGEIARAMSDPRYDPDSRQFDAAYAARVDSRLAATGDDVALGPGAAARASSQEISATGPQRATDLDEAG